MTKVSVDNFKEKVDKYLENILDEPHVDGLIPSGCNLFSAAPSNSILDQVRDIRRPGA